MVMGWLRGGYEVVARWLQVGHGMVTRVVKGLLQGGLTH